MNQLLPTQVRVPHSRSHMHIFTSRFHGLDDCVLHHLSPLVFCSRARGHTHTHTATHLFELLVDFVLERHFNLTEALELFLTKMTTSR